MNEIVFPTIPDLEQMCTVAGTIFKFDDDDDLAKPTVENCLRTIRIDKHNYICLKDRDVCMAWSCVLPTSKENMDNFLAGTINEVELFELAKGKPSFEALYLVVMVVLPEYRKRGLASFLVKTQIEYFKNNFGIHDYYSWWYSEEGKKLGASLEKELGIEIKSLNHL